MLAWCFSRYRARISPSDQLGAAHIAYEDPLIPIDNLGRELMQGIVPSARRPAVQALRLTPMAAPLGLGDLALEVPIEMTRLELLPVARRDRIFQTQIEPDILVLGEAGCERALDRNTQPPVPDRILGKTAAFPLRALELRRFKHPNRLAREAQGLAFALQLRSFERDPPQ
jgi:hypothetical protein